MGEEVCTGDEECVLVMRRVCVLVMRRVCTGDEECVLVMRRVYW